MFLLAATAEDGELRRAVFSAARADDVRGLHHEADAAEVEVMMACAVQHHSRLFSYLVLDAAHITSLGQAVSCACYVRIDCAIWVDHRALHGWPEALLILRRGWHISRIPERRAGIVVWIEGWIGIILRELCGISIEGPSAAEEVRAADDEQDDNKNYPNGCIATCALFLGEGIVVIGI